MTNIQDSDQVEGLPGLEEIALRLIDRLAGIDPFQGPGKACLWCSGVGEHAETCPWLIARDLLTPKEDFFTPVVEWNGNRVVLLGPDYVAPDAGRAYGIGLSMNYAEAQAIGGIFKGEVYKMTDDPITFVALSYRGHDMMALSGPLVDEAVKTGPHSRIPAIRDVISQ